MALSCSFLCASVLDFRPLNRDFPGFKELFFDVEVGNNIATGGGFPEGFETINAAYAYLHKDSPYWGQAAYLDRLKILLEARISPWIAGESLTDISGTFHAAYAYALLKHHRPEDLTAQERTDWELGIAQMCNAILENSLLYDDHILASAWLNGDIRLALGVYFGGVALGNAHYTTQAQEAIDLVLSQAVVGDGASHYVGFNNEVPTYRNTTINSFLWWWTLTGSPEVKAALDKTVPYIPLSVEPSGFQEQSTAISYKHQYNGLRGRSAALATAYLYGDRYNYFFGKQVESTFSEEYGLLYAIHYQPGLTTLRPPENFIIHDRAIMGPRGRWENWAFVATGRNVQSPDPDHEDQGYDGKMGGKNTFVGALALGEWANKTSLKAALDGVTVEFKNKQGQATDIGRSSADGGIYRFLSQDENTATITRETFGSLSTSYRISDRVSSNATPDWGVGTRWLGDQLWLLTEDRLVGLVQIHNDEGDTVYGLDARFVLVGGRLGTIGQYQELVEVIPDREFDYGELSVRIIDENFGGSVSTVYQGITDTNSFTEDKRTAVIRLHDSLDNQDDTPIPYPSGTRRFALVECTRTEKPFAQEAVNVLPSNPYFGIVEVTESNRKFRLIQNLTAQTRTYSGNMWPGGNNRVASIHRSWTPGAEVLPAAAPYNLAVELPPHSHAIVVTSENTVDHTGNTQFYEDLFLEGDSVVAENQSVNTAADGAVGVRLQGLVSDGDPVYSIETFPAHGTLVGVPPILSYTPDPNFTGTDSILFTVSNQAGETAQGEVLINVTPPNNLGPWTPRGYDVDREFSELSNTGFSLRFSDDTDGRADIGAVSVFESPITLDSVERSVLSFKFKIDDITSMGGSNNSLRVGFLNDDIGPDQDATLQASLGYGAPGNRFDARFSGSSDNSNIFKGGTAQDVELMARSTPLYSGGSSVIELTLNYISANEDGSHNYRIVLMWDGYKHESSLITRNTDTWDSVYIQTNSSAVQVGGDGFRVSEAELRKPGPAYLDIKFKDWLEQFGLPFTELAQNSDADEYSDLWEFILGGDPSDPVVWSQSPLSIESSDGLIRCEFPKRILSDELGVSYNLQRSLDLENWENDFSYQSEYGPINDLFETVSVVVNEGPESFLRIRIVSDMGFDFISD
ncbi:MAG: Ig-like domain-containing protein [Opitutales bacterium]